MSPVTCSSTCAGRATRSTGTSPSRSTSRRSRGTAGHQQVPLPPAVPATYGITPAAYLSERRVERAQDLLRSTNLTVTEVCHAVGFSSLGSFSSRFREIVGESPREFQQRWGADAPRIPGCFVLMWGLAERKTASQEKPARRPGA